MVGSAALHPTAKMSSIVIDCGTVNALYECTRMCYNVPGTRHSILLLTPPDQHEHVWAFHFTRAGEIFDEADIVNDYCSFYSTGLS